MRDGKGGIDVIPTFVGMIREMYLLPRADAKLLARSATSAGTLYTFWSKAGVNRITTTMAAESIQVSNPPRTTAPG
jgi:hypothetical protein